MKRVVMMFLSIVMVASLVACKQEKKAETVFDKKGTFDATETLKDVKVTADNVILSNKVIDGNLIIEVPGVEGDLTLNNVSVKGKIIVNNPSVEYNIRMYDVTAQTMNISNGAIPVRLYVSKGSEIPLLTTSGSVILTEQALTKNGFGDVDVKGASDAVITLITSGIDTLTVSDSSNSSILTDTGSLIKNLVINVPTQIASAGVIDLLTANANVTIDTTPGSTVLKEGVLINGGDGKTTTVATTTAGSVITTKKPAPSTTKPTITKKPVTTTAPITTTKPVVTTTVTNTAPIITAANVTLKLSEVFNPLTGVTIYDKEDGGYITVTSTHIVSNNVNTAIVGTYSVVYAYTDRGGLRTQFSRSVTISDNRLDTPTNLTTYVDRNGDLVFAWSSVKDATYYEVYLNGKFEAEVTRSATNYTFDANDILGRRSATLEVIAISNKNDIKNSYAEKISYANTQDIVDIPTKIAMGKETKFTYFPSPLGKSGNLTEIDVRFYCDGSAVEGLKINNQKTDRYGRVILPYDMNKGIDLKMIFDVAGDYEVLLTLGSRSNDFSETFNFTVTRNSSEYLKISEFGIEAGSRWSTGVIAYFKLSQELNLASSLTDITIDFDWSTALGDKGTVTFNNRDFGTNKFLAGVEYNAKLKSTDVIDPNLEAALKDGKRVTITAYLSVTDNYGDEVSKTSNSLYFYDR